MVRKILEEKSLPNSKVKEIFDKIKDEKLNHFQRRTAEYVRKFSAKDSGKSYEILNELLKLEDISIDEAVQIVNLAPKSREEIRTVFYHRKTILMTEFLDKILEILNKRN
jgi:DNA-directed RNA polymerase subunit F